MATRAQVIELIQAEFERFVNGHSNVGMSAERSLVNNSSVVLPLDAMGNAVDAPFSVFDSSAETGWRTWEGAPATAGPRPR